MSDDDTLSTAGELPGSLDASSSTTPAPELTALVVMRPSATSRLLEALLARVGMSQIESVASVDAGLECLRAREFDVLTCEQDLGDGGRAYELCEQARRESVLPPSTMVVVVSRDRSEQAVMSVAEFEPDCCLLRPLAPDDTVERLVRAWMQKRSLDPLFDAMRAGDPTLVDLQAQMVGSSGPALAKLADRLASEWLLHAGDLDAAEAYARRALNVGTPAWALCRLAQVRVKQGRLSDASKLLERAIAQNPRHLDSLSLLSEIRERQGRTAEALEALDRLSAQVDPTTPRMRRTGKLARKAGDLERAETALRWVDHNSVEGTPESIEDRADLIEVLQLQGRDHAAHSLHAMQQQRLKDHPDAPMLATIFELDRLPSDASRAVRRTLGDRLVNTFIEESAQVSIPVAVRAVQACLRAGLREQGMVLSAAISRSRRAEQRDLDVLREFLGQLAMLPSTQSVA